ncbi:MAG: D-beta-D-heptose 7-phosphate kinase, partial [Chloroflexi bacterium]
MTTHSDTEALLQLLARMAGHRVLVLGDVYLDHWIFGRPNRISREAPVMVLDEERREDLLGGGAAPALALRALGCDVAFAGVVGDDAAGDTVRELLRSHAIDPAGVITDPSRQTTVKTRLVAEGFLRYPQQIVRLDRQTRAPVDRDIEAQLALRFQHAYAAVLVSDYRSGVVTSGVVAAARAAANRSGALLTVDSQGELAKFQGFDLVKCNQAEAEAVLGAPLDAAPAREHALTTLRRELDCAALVVTRGADGAALVTRTAYCEVPAANRSEVFDVTGAGDTVV